MKDATATMGSILPDDVGGRDAVHVAVVAVTAGQILYPGQDIGLKPDQQTAVSDVEWIGIVDPYIQAKVQPGQRFWMFLYPRSITSLRHQWTHPAFNEGTATIYHTPAQKLASERWLRMFSEQASVDYNDMLANATISPEAMRFGYDVNMIDIPDEFWDHIEVVTGTKVPKGLRASYFSCAC